jgi:histidine kinase 2/3/4 (cytokinin receptor)
MQILRSEVENNLNASFVILGLVASVPSLNNLQWRNYTRRTLFLRPNVKTLVYCARVLASQRTDFERKYNATIKTILPNGTWVDQSPQEEYAPVLFETEDLQLYMYDVGSSATLSPALFSARK